MSIESLSDATVAKIDMTGRGLEVRGLKVEKTRAMVSVQSFEKKRRRPKRFVTQLVVDITVTKRAGRTRTRS